MFSDFIVLFQRPDRAVYRRKQSANEAHVRRVYDGPGVRSGPSGSEAEAVRKARSPGHSRRSGPQSVLGRRIVVRESTDAEAKLSKQPKLRKQSVIGLRFFHKTLKLLFCRLDACESKVEIVTPYWASNSAGKLRAIVNTQHFEQAIHQEICS